MHAAPLDALRSGRGRDAGPIATGGSVDDYNSQGGLRPLGVGLLGLAVCAGFMAVLFGLKDTISHANRSSKEAPMKKALTFGCSVVLEVLGAIVAGIIAVPLSA